MLRRIGVFDSGIGGLTVLRQLRAAFPELDMIYLGDVARVPYGGRSVETITRYACDDVRFLLRFGVDAIVVACGTVSSNALDVLRETFDLPIYGVIESASRLAAQLTRTGAVGVIGTQATIRSGAYQRYIAAADPQVHITARACPLLVPLVENGVEPMDPVAEMIVDRYMSPFDSENIDVMIMGCTHYPVYRPALEKRLPGVAMIDVGEALAQALRGKFGQGEGQGTTAYYATERSAAFDQVVRIMDPGVDPAAIRVENPFR
ncbi:MAG: glutamate racemase [Oscillospiraceae bacterium]|nr:glutamate racemase [Oscillospiraceae bacterium]MBR6208261.1 glutamate racemase [Oscillospiraceae bacterium]